MIHVGMYTKCSEMFCFEKSLNFDKSVRCEKNLIEQATKSLITYSELVIFVLLYVPLE